MHTKVEDRTGRPTVLVSNQVLEEFLAHDFISTKNLDHTGIYIVCEETKVRRIRQGILVHEVEGISDDHLNSLVS